jgi:DNA-binding HxlR family transcriptional regulator
MDRERFAAIHCSVARSAGVVADPWTLLVLRDLFLGVGRFETLRRDLGVATNVLADRLDRLVADGLVVRHQYTHRPPRDEYQLTAAGRDLYTVMLTLLAWGDRHRGVDGPPMRLIHTSCGKPTTPKVTCSRCGGELSIDTVTAKPGPGGRTAPGTALIADLLAQTAGVRVDESRTSGPPSATPGRTRRISAAARGRPGRQ